MDSLCGLGVQAAFLKVFIYAEFLFFALLVPLIAISLVSSKNSPYYCLSINLPTPQTNFDVINAILPRV